jgi:hypothetical protein
VPQRPILERATMPNNGAAALDLYIADVLMIVDKVVAFE